MTTANEDVIRAAIEGAAEVRDPLESLAARAAENPGVPFEGDTLEALAALKARDQPTFEALRSQLRRADVRVGELDKAISSVDGGNSDGRGPKQADVLIELAGSAELFRTTDGVAYADIDINGHRETYRIRQKGFKQWLARRFYTEQKGAPNSEALQSAVNLIEADALFDAPQREICIRVGGHDGRLYLDLADDNWRAVEIDADGWRIVDEPPVRFRRAAGMQPIPVPKQGGSIETLRTFLNLATDEDFTLVVAWALAVLRNEGPYPVLVLSGEQGSAKSTFSAILRKLLDPNHAPLRALPREDRDLFIAASNGHILAFDNVSHLQPWISDTLCRLATGGGFAVRQLYSDQDEVLFDAQRPIVLNAIEDIISRPDLADRAIILNLNPIPEDKRMLERKLWAAFEKERPALLGTLLDAVSHGLRELPHTNLPGYPRMADFAVWVTACEPAFWQPGAFWAAYSDNLADAVDTVLEADLVGTAVRALMDGLEQTVWTGTAADLLGTLSLKVEDSTRKLKTWPDTPRALAGRMRRAATFLRKAGIDVVFTTEGRGRARARTITISRQPEYGGILAPPPSPPSPPTEKTISHNGLSGDGGDCGTVPTYAPTVPTVPIKSLKNNDGDDGDGGDANLQPQSGWEEII